MVSNLDGSSPNHLTHIVAAILLAFVATSLIVISLRIRAIALGIHDLGPSRCMSGRRHLLLAYSHLLIHKVQFLGAWLLALRILWGCDQTDSVLLVLLASLTLCAACLARRYWVELRIQRLHGWIRWATRLPVSFRSTDRILEKVLLDHVCCSFYIINQSKVNKELSLRVNLKRIRNDSRLIPTLSVLKWGIPPLELAAAFSCSLMHFVLWRNNLLPIINIYYY